MASSAAQKGVQQRNNPQRYRQRVASNGCSAPPQGGNALFADPGRSGYSSHALAGTEGSVMHKTDKERASPSAMRQPPA